MPIKLTKSIKVWRWAERIKKNVLLIFMFYLLDFTWINMFMDNILFVKKD